MFGPFGGPFPEGKYSICTSNLAMSVPIILNNTVVTMTAPELRNDYQTWALEYGTKGYKIRNVASDNYLTYIPWAIPSRMVDVYNSVIASAKTSVEWKLIQTSTGTNSRTFQIRMIAGPDLQPADDYSLFWNGVGLYYLQSNRSNFLFQALGPLANAPLPTSLEIADKTKCLIRSVFSPQIALELRPSFAHLVVGRNITNEDSQVWTFQKGGRGFKIKNAESGDNLSHAVVANTPSNAQNQTMVCQDDRATDYIVVPSTQGYELRSATDQSLCVTIWNLDANNNCWVYLDKGPSSGNAYANQQWFFTKPE